MATKFFTNHKGKTLLQKLEGIFRHMEVYHFDALVGYFHMSGYHRIHEYLERVQEVRILVGINIDELVWKAYRDGIEFVQDKETTKEKLLDVMVADVQRAEYAYPVEKGMLHFMEGIRSGRIQVKAHPSKKLHAKIYIFRQQHEHEHAGWGSVITGSSNLTEPGLERNFEFNVELRDHDDVRFALETFEDLWKEGLELAPDFIEKLKQKTYLNDACTPFEIYVKFLIEYFGRSIEYDPDIANDLPAKYTSLRYQVDAVKQGVEMLKRHNGFFLADVVGLGKTVVAAMIMKRFYHINGWKTRVLVVHPPALKNAWVNTIEDFDLPFKVDFISNGSLHKISETKAQGYDLIVVDEAHKFRSDTSDMFHQLQTLCKTKRKNPGPDGDRTKKVILVSATPLNNRPEDIRNLILLFQDGRNSTLDVNIIRFFRSRIDRYNKLKTHPDRQTALEGIRQLYEEIRTGILEQITIRRTRTDIRENQEYWEDVTKQGLTFPEVEKPKEVLYQLDPVLNSLFEDTMRCLRNPETGLKYYRYQAIRFLTEPYKSRYENADLVSDRLAYIMKTLLVKRLDSSFHAFIQSLKRYKDANRAMIRMFENDRIHIAPPLDVSKYILEGDEETLLEKMEKLKLTDPSIQTFAAQDFDEAFLSGLQQDQAVIDQLVEKWETWNQTGQDPKLDEFVRLLNNGLLKAPNGERKKLVVFSEYADTTGYLLNALQEHRVYRILTVDSSNHKALADSIAQNFDARMPLDKRRNDYDIIITTEVLAEGVNLHRSDTILNYDIPWNSTRLMQRIGRVNRIGTNADRIHIYNFYPTEQTENEIELHKKALLKLQAFHSALGEDSQIYSSEEEFGTFGMFEKVEDDERDETLRLLLELRAFKEHNPEWYRKIEKMPLRSRCGRASSTPNRPAEETVVFLKNNRRDAFFRVRPDNSVEECSFLDTARYFQATADEKALPLPTGHHDQVNAAIAQFKNLQADERAAEKQATKFGPNEKNALAYLDAFARLTTWSEDDIRLIRLAQEAIKQAVYQKLPRELNQLRKIAEKSKLRPAVIADKIIEILKTYPLREPRSEQIETTPGPTSKADEPNIIISESFI